MLPGCFFASGGTAVNIPVDLPGAAYRTLSVTLVYDLNQIQQQPDERAAGLVVYSLGYTACVPSVHSFATMLASRGFVVAIPDHGDIYKVCLSVSETLEAEDLQVMDAARQADGELLAYFASLDREKDVTEEQLEDLFYYRNADLHATIEHMTHSDTYPFGSLRDRPVFLVGYSLGGWNALNVAGAGTRFPELHSDVTAVVCQNTFVGAFTAPCIQQVPCPVFYLAGTEDGLCPYVRNLFEWRPENACLVEINGADHYLFAVDLCTSPIIAAWQPDSCTEEALNRADAVNALMVEFIEVMASTGNLPEIESLESFDPDLFNAFR